MLNQDDIEGVKKMLSRKEDLLQLLRGMQWAIERNNPVKIYIGDLGGVKVHPSSPKYFEACKLPMDIVKDQISDIDYECMRLGVSPSVKEKANDYKK